MSKKENREIKDKSETKPSSQKKSTILRLKTLSEKFSLPIRYHGKIVRITHSKETVLSIPEIPYESMIHIKRAMKNKEVTEIKRGA